MSFRIKTPGAGFPAGLEGRFRSAVYRRHFRMTRRVILLGLLFFGAYGLVDWMLFPEVRSILLGLRLGVFLPLGLLAYALSGSRRFIRVREPVLVGLIVSAGFCIATMTAIAPPPNNYAYMPGLVIVFLFGYILANLRFREATASGWSVLLYFNIVSIIWGHDETVVLLSNNLTFVISNLAGMVASYSLEAFARKDFLKTRALRQEQRRVEQINRLLDDRVRQRTEALTRANEELHREAGEREEAQRQLKYLADHDPLTGVHNRRYGQDFLQRLTESESPGGEVVAVLFLDLDHFKRVNDRLGHHVGDLLLKKVAARLQTCLRAGDLVARFGGDEFIAILPHVVDTALAERVMARLLKEIAKPYRLSDQEIHLTASVGASFFPNDATDAPGLIQSADSAMYLAKQEGRNRHRVFTQAIFEQMQWRMKLEGDLRRAIEDQELFVHYQPKVRLSDRRVTGVEALARWDHPFHGSVSPSLFVSIAEESGLISLLGDLILRKSLEDLSNRSILGTENLCLNVNLSALQFSESSTVFRVAELVETYGIPPEQLCIEVTESAIMRDLSEAQKLLDSLRILGVQISVDDFGTGYSSLAYLSRLPLNELKIDRSFVGNIGYVAGDESIVSSTIRLGHSLGLRVVSEGVETESQLQFLEAEGCDEVQGYLFGRPAPAGEIPGQLPRAASTYATESA
jgi:diguanylate cyclase (GGDEF)-like protein